MLVKTLQRFFSTPWVENGAQEAYVKLVDQSRKQWFYRELGVSDTLDGRFDVIVLHLFMLIHRLRPERSEEAAHFIRALSEVFFADMDRSLREMGSTDTGVGKRVQKMAEAFYGRLHSYEQTLVDREAFRESLKRNLYRAGDPAENTLEALVGYVQRNVAALKDQPVEALLTGEVEVSN